MVNRDCDGCFKIITEIEQKGISYSNVLSQMLRYIRLGFLLQATSSNNKLCQQEVSEIDQQQQQEFVSFVEQTQKLEFNRIFRSFMFCLKELDGSYLDRLVVENYCFEWCQDPGFPNFDTTETNEAVIDKNNKQNFIKDSVEVNKKIVTQHKLESVAAGDMLSEQQQNSVNKESKTKNSAAVKPKAVNSLLLSLNKDKDEGEDKNIEEIKQKPEKPSAVLDRGC